MNKLLKNIQQILIDLKKNKNIIFDKLLSGFDERFIFDFNITNDGKILNYNYSEIKDRLQELLNNNIIDKNEYELLNSKVIRNPNIYDFYLLFNELKKYFQLQWNYDEIMKGEKNVRNKIFKLIDSFKEYNINLLLNKIKFNYILLLNDIYLKIDLNLIFISQNKTNNTNKHNNTNKTNKTNKNNNNNKNLFNYNEIKNINLFKKKYIFINDSKLQINDLYQDIYKNYAKNNFFEMLINLKKLIQLLQSKNKDNYLYKKILNEITYKSVISPLSDGLLAI